eukprot:2954887-Pyramimonas_sp.AAC.1
MVADVAVLLAWGRAALLSVFWWGCTDVCKGCTGAGCRGTPSGICVEHLTRALPHPRFIIYYI